MIKEAIIIAGGKGIRLMPYTQTKPKALVEVGGKSMLEWQIEWLQSNGVEHIVIATGWMSKKIESWARANKRNFTVSFTISSEDEPLGTGGAIKKAMTCLRDKDSRIVVANVDDLNDIDVDKLEESLGVNDHASIVVANPVSPYGKVIIKDGKIIDFVDKPVLKDIWVSCGIYVFNPKIYDLLPDIGMIETVTFPKCKLAAYKHPGKWVTITSSKDVVKFEERWRE